jgi:hypothetical protein
MHSVEKLHLAKHGHLLLVLAGQKTKRFLKAGRFRLHSVARVAGVQSLNSELRRKPGSE